MEEEYCTLYHCPGDCGKLGHGGSLSIPWEVIQAALKVCEWFESRDIQDWKLCGLQQRKD